MLPNRANEAALNRRCCASTAHTRRRGRPRPLVIPRQVRTLQRPLDLAGPPKHAQRPRLVPRADRWRRPVLVDRLLPAAPPPPPRSARGRAVAGVLPKHLQLLPFAVHLPLEKVQLIDEVRCRLSVNGVCPAARGVRVVCGRERMQWRCQATREPRGPPIQPPPPSTDIRRRRCSSACSLAKESSSASMVAIMPVSLPPPLALLLAAAGRRFPLRRVPGVGAALAAVLSSPCDFSSDMTVCRLTPTECDLPVAWCRNRVRTRR